MALAESSRSQAELIPRSVSISVPRCRLSWLETRAPKVYQAILDADKAGQGNFSGHGSAIAQAYNHMIMPLANRRDKVTQVEWGIRDFQHRFGRLPEGLWLPETAVDTETLEILAERDIRFTILAPRQARRDSKIGGRIWKEVSGERIDPSMAYVCPDSPSGRSNQLIFLRWAYFASHRFRESAR